MAFVQCTKVSLAYGDRDILKEVSLFLGPGSHSALTGANGSGKSTLMKVVAGLIQPDRGERSVERECRIAYLPQSGIVHRGRTLREEVEQAFGFIQLLIQQMEQIGEKLAHSRQEDESTRILLEEYHRLQEKITLAGYYEREQRIARVLQGLGFENSDWNRPTEVFSGGWQMRIALAKVLLEQPDILLLDEPTNYLDVEARTWLEEWLKEFPGAYLIVSHDRYFLDVTVTEVYELFQGTLRRYVGNYSVYEKTRQGELETLLAQYEAQQEEIAKTEDFIRRFRYNAARASLVQDRIKRLEKMERIEIPESLKRLHIELPSPPHCGRRVLVLEGLAKSYGSLRVFRNLDLLVEAGEKLLVVGRNGAGKTSLLRIIAGLDRDYEGTLQVGTDVQIGYFSQDVAETMTGSQSVLETLESEAPLHLIPKLRDLLAAFLFRGDDVYKAVSVLSGGEKSRLALLRLLLHPVNLLILDEPTNHLDLHSKDVLLEALQKYPGTVIFVSHDRAFMEALSTKTLELAGGRGRLFYGNYSYYLERIEQESALTEGMTRVSPPKEQNLSAAARYREEEKKRQAQIRRLERQEAELISHIEQLEAKKQSIEAALADPNTYLQGPRVKELQGALKEVSLLIDATSAEWERCALELGALRSEARKEHA
ncbi:MAG: ABC-F family ATP-binding cassette domain-containing protein [Treponemataceae bacterium]|nr:ABC-F family ATP-binding cassette domain-containing protein [Treponemataceae bacterium]